MYTSVVDLVELTAVTADLEVCTQFSASRTTERF